MFQVVYRHVTEPTDSSNDRNTTGQHDDSQQSPSRDETPSSSRLSRGDRPKSVKDFIKEFGKFYILRGVYKVQ